MFPALFLDRDGVLIEYRPNYVRSWEDVTIYASSVQALVSLQDSRYKIVIVTNQSTIGRGIISMETAVGINQRLVAEIKKAGGRVNGIFMCPHDPQDNCSCRKPKPGLIRQAALSLNLDLDHSILVGDALSDLEAGKAAGVGQLILVRTGRGQQEEQLIHKHDFNNLFVYDNLAEAVKRIIVTPIDIR